MFDIAITELPHFGFCECDCGCEIHDHLIPDLYDCSGKLLCSSCIEGLCKNSNEQKNEQLNLEMKNWICPRCQDLKDLNVSMVPIKLMKYPKDRRRKCWLMECSNCGFNLFVTKDRKFKLSSN